MQHNPSSKDIDDRWVQHQRRNNKPTQTYACILCADRKVFTSANDLFYHAKSAHPQHIPQDPENERDFRKKYEAESIQKRNRDDKKPPVLNEAASPPPEPGGGKRPFSSNASPVHSTRLPGLQGLNIGTALESKDIIMTDVDNQIEQPRKRPAVGDGISAGSRSPRRETSQPPSPRRSRARPSSQEAGPEIEAQNPFTNQRPPVSKKQLWSPDNDTNSSLTRGAVDTSNIASIQANKSRALLQKNSRKPYAPATQHNSSPRSTFSSNTQGLIPSAILGKSSQQNLDSDSYDIILQPETRPISQEQLVAEVKGIYAGLVMVEAKCIEVDNKQASLTDTAQSKLNNEQWQALIALHRTLLHEHHDFFLASQHPSASLALQRLASKYAMPARMWRHGIHSFLELLRHRLPASLDHMLAFIYLAYSMMALLYETVPAFEDTWIECLGDLGRYRMAIEDDDIRDREVWTGVARHWYSKASDKAPTTGRLYHHLAILARPNALQQLFYYAKSLCVVVPFTSARESVLTLFEPVLNSDGNTQGQYRLPPLDTAYIKAQGLLFTNRDPESFESAVNDFTNLLDNQIGRVTRKWMEQGSHIAISNSVALLGFAAKDNLLIRAISSENNIDDDQMASANEKSKLLTSFKKAQLISNETLTIVLQRIGDPNVYPFIHCTLVFMVKMAQHQGSKELLGNDFPWKDSCVMLNTLLVNINAEKLVRLGKTKFPTPEDDEARPLPEDYSIRGLLYADNYFPEDWFATKIDEEEKYQERASMTAQRKDRIIHLAMRIVKSSWGLDFDHDSFQFTPRVQTQIDTISSRALTFESSASATTVGTTRSATWNTQRTIDDLSDDDEPRSTTPTHAADN